jgi:hypothetical protein
MILCHSLATNDELTFTKYVRKINARHQENHRDKTAHSLCGLFRNKSFIEATEMIKFKSVKNLFDDAMQLSIACKRELISFDLIKYAIRNSF